MKYMKRTIILIIIFCLLAVPFTVSAIDTGLTTEALSNEEISELVKKTEFRKITSYLPQAAKCFDVRDDHMIVIGADTGDTAVIAVYDNYGNFQYGFEIEQLGSFRVMWSGNDIAYYSIRDSLLFKIDKEGKILDIYQVESTTENSIYDRDILQSATRTVDGAIYKMTNGHAFVDVLSGSFKKIIRTDTAGTTVIYDASSNWYARVVGGLVVFGLISLLLVYGTITGIKKTCKQIRRKTGDSSES